MLSLLYTYENVYVAYGLVPYEPGSALMRIFYGTGSWIFWFMDLLVHGSWFMVHGSWFMVHGSWFHNSLPS